MAIGAPPQLSWPEGALGGAAVAFALVGLDAAAAERHRHPQRAGPQERICTRPSPPFGIHSPIGLLGSETTSAGAGVVAATFCLTGFFAVVVGFGRSSLR